MKRSSIPLLLLAAAALASACGSSSSVSTPTISDFKLTASTTPGGTETGTFILANSAGTGGLSLHLTLKDPAGATSGPTVEPLRVAGGSGEQMEANGEVGVVLPSNAPVGTYTVTITVSDGADTSNALSGTFDVT